MQASDTDPMVALMGATGTGKSAFINLLTGDDDIRIGRDLDSKTFDINTSIYVDEGAGLCVTLVDTPGFDDSREGVSDIDILGKIAKFLQDDGGRKLNGIIYLHRITDPRLGGLAKKNLRVFRELCGDNVFGNVRIVTTYWNLINEQEGKDREVALANGAFKPFIDAGAKLVRHDKELESARLIISELIRKPPVLTKIQEELNAGRTLGDTSAGAVIVEEMKELQKKHEKEMEDLKKEMDDAANEDDEQLKAELDEERRKLEERMARVEEDRKKLAMVQTDLGARPELDTAMNMATEVRRETKKPIRSEGNRPEHTAYGAVDRKEVDRIMAKHREEIADLDVELKSMKECYDAATQDLGKKRSNLQQELARLKIEQARLNTGLDDAMEARERLKRENQGKWHQDRESKRTSWSDAQRGDNGESTPRLQTQLAKETRERGDIDQQREKRQSEVSGRVTVNRAFEVERKRPYAEKAAEKEIPVVPNTIRTENERVPVPPPLPKRVQPKAEALLQKSRGLDYEQPNNEREDIRRVAGKNWGTGQSTLPDQERREQQKQQQRKEEFSAGSQFKNTFRMRQT